MDTTQKLEVTWWRAARIWWSLLWRGLFYTIIITFLTGILVRLLAASLGLSEHVQPYAEVMGLIAGVPIGIWVVKIVLEKHYSDFRIVLLPSLESLLDDEPDEKN